MGTVHCAQANPEQVSFFFGGERRHTGEEAHIFLSDWFLFNLVCGWVVLSHFMGASMGCEELGATGAWFGSDWVGLGDWWGCCHGCARRMGLG